MAMTGINYDDLHGYLYASEDYGKTWKNISAGLPDEPINVIKEDPTNENILYAGGLRGVYISINYGGDWSYLGNKMPAAAIADLEIHESTMDLIAGTHGRGIFKINLKPIHKMINQNRSIEKDYLFEMEMAKAPWFNSSGGEPDYRTVEKTSFTFWLSHAKMITLSILDSTNNKVWSAEVRGNAGFNEFRWDMVVNRQTSDYPYFVHYEKFIEAGNYKVMLSSGDDAIEQTFKVVKGVSPYMEK